MLPDPALKPAYSQAVWLYVYRDFSGSQEDLAAERIAIRFGLTSWPQMLFADPVTMRVIAQPRSRNVEGFLAAAQQASQQVKPTSSLVAAEAIRDAEARAIELEKSGSVPLAQQRLGDQDIVVRVRALSILAEKSPEVVATRARELLQVPNDPFRYQVCQVLAKSAGGTSRETAPAVAALHELVNRPMRSRNPNVLRINAVKALAALGNRKSVDVIAPLASSGEFLNGLTGTSVDALVAIAERDPESRRAVRDVLVRSFPTPPESSSEFHLRYCAALAKRVHAGLEKVTATKIAFPDEYNRMTREALIDEWK